MSKINMIKSVVGNKLGRGILIGKKFSPEILMVAGVTGIVASTVLACRATLKANEVFERHNHKIDKIKIVKEHANNGELTDGLYSDSDYKKDLTVAYVQTGVDFIRLYGPAFTLGALSIGCILGSHNIMRKRNVAIIAAYKAVEKSFADYRKRVVDEFGEEKDRLLKNGIKQEKIPVVEIDENGNKVKSNKVVETVDPNVISQYARFFDESSSQWVKSPEYNLTFLKCQQNYFNDLLNARGHVFLNEVYDGLGIPRSQAGQVVGWVKEEGDGYIDFGIFDIDNPRARDFVNGYERSILLDFNVTGVIYDMI